MMVSKFDFVRIKLSSPSSFSRLFGLAIKHKEHDKCKFNFGFYG